MSSSERTMRARRSTSSVAMKVHACVSSPFFLLLLLYQREVEDVRILYWPGPPFILQMPARRTSSHGPFGTPRRSQGGLLPVPLSEEIKDKWRVRTVRSCANRHWMMCMFACFFHHHRLRTPRHTNNSNCTNNITWDKKKGKGRREGAARIDIHSWSSWGAFRKCNRKRKKQNQPSFAQVFNAYQGCLLLIHIQLVRTRLIQFTTQIYGSSQEFLANIHNKLYW